MDRRPFGELVDEVQIVMSRLGGDSRRALGRHGLLWRVGCINSIGVLGGDGVLVYEAAEPVFSADRCSWRAREGSRRPSGFGRREAQRAVWPMGVVVLDELPQHPV
jgi:hypothetical protein